ncbi:MAG TPA: hypothetical protein VNT99_06165 [Methylomirabilota bacterium]|nr:hypothetical protein [Methylomirabilota bacterium]
MKWFDSPTRVKLCPYTALAIVALGFSLARAADVPVSEVFVRIRNDKGEERLTAEKDFRRNITEWKIAGPAFVAITSSPWPTGLVPVFPLASESGFQLRRLPPRGQENDVEPLFFALPPPDEPHATNIAGPWSCAATNAHGSKHYLDWELANEGESVAGRFSQSSEYRVAFITGGTFRSNRFALNVDYINNRYVLNGEWRGGKLLGSWRHLDNEENGTWEGTRPTSKAAVPPATESVALFEWRRGDERRYSIETSLSESGWTRAARPLCRVWRGK